MKCQAIVKVSRKTLKIVNYSICRVSDDYICETVITKVKPFKIVLSVIHNVNTIFEMEEKLKNINISDIWQIQSNK